MTPKQFVENYNKMGSIRAVGNLPGMTRWKARRLYAQALNDGLMGPVPKNTYLHTKKHVEATIKGLESEIKPIPKRGVKRYLFTSAQNDTKIHEQFWDNLLVLREHYRAELHVSRFTYVRRGLGASGDKAKVTRKEINDENPMVWNSRLHNYFSDRRLQIAPSLVWCGEMNILPTAVRPLSDLQVYTGSDSGIFPHVKIALNSVPNLKEGHTKFNYTTGTVTLKNYIQRKAGLKAEFHHCYGALLVEVDSEGNWYCRQINAEDSGTIYDLDIKVEDGKLTIGNRVEAIVWGDIHALTIDKDVKKLGWTDRDSMVNVLNPKYQFVHDVLDFRARSHHELSKPHTMYKRFIQQVDDVEKEVRVTGEFLSEISRDYDGEIIVVDSNHHDHIGRWLQEQNGLKDPLNAEYWLELNTKIIKNIKAGNDPDYFKEALALVGFDDWDNVRFLKPDESFIICDDDGEGVECGMHGHAGPNGSRGTINSFARIGRKANIGHSHTSNIMDGVYQSGTSAELKPDWTGGPSSWSHSHTVNYTNGKRAIITMWNSKWRA